MKKNESIRRCCICRATQKDGTYFRGSYYHKEDNEFTDTIFSEKCVRVFYGEDFDKYFKNETWELKSCPEHEDIRG